MIDASEGARVEAGLVHRVRALNAFLADVYAQRRVLRDRVVTCRALNLPTRYVFGYLPEIGAEPHEHPMDFSAWVEVFLGGRWHTFDPRNNDTMPRVGRVLIGRGRDALDVAMITTFGASRLAAMTVTAEQAATAAPAGSAHG